MTARAFCFDNDGTLYSYPENFGRDIVERMIAYLAKLMRVSPEYADSKRAELFQKYGVKSILFVFYQEGILDSDRIHDFIRSTYLSVDPGTYNIAVDPQLRSTLQVLGGLLYVHTNSPAEFAEKILDYLGIKDLFAGIFGIFEHDGYGKPDPRSFGRLLREIPALMERWYIDDGVVNLVAAHELGFKTVLIGNSPSEPSSFQPDLCLSRVSDLVTM